MTDLYEEDEDFLNEEFNLKSEFMNGDPERTALLSRCEKYAGWTLPTAFPDETINDGQEMQNDYQSLGAQATTNLSNKISMALFQPSRPFFKMELTPAQKEQILGSGTTRAELDKQLAQTERDAMKELNEINAREQLGDAITQLIITGNCMPVLHHGEKMTVHTLRDYALTRDLQGTVLKIIIRETQAIKALSHETRAIAIEQGYDEADEVSLYTGIELTEKDTYRVWQEMEDVCYCHKKVGKYSKDSLPWMPLVWKRARGNNYGTGHVEDYSGDFTAFSNLSRAEVDFDAVATDFKILVNPTGMTNAKDLNDAESGEYVQGLEEDIHVHSADVGKQGDHLDRRNTKVGRRIAAAFLLNTAVTRDAERVTAEEIRTQAEELESSLGGVYTRLAGELQLPLAKRLLSRMDAAFKHIKPIIVTGFESLSRLSDLGNIRAFLSDLAMIDQLSDTTQEYINMSGFITVLGTGHGVEYEKFLKTEDQVNAAREKRAQQEAMAKGQEANAVNQAQTGQLQ